MQVCVQLRLTSDEEVPLCSSYGGWWKGGLVEKQGSSSPVERVWGHGTNALLEFVCRCVETPGSGGCVASHQGWVECVERTRLSSHQLCDPEQVTSQDTAFLHPARNQEKTNTHDICPQEGPFSIVLTAY